MDIELEKCQTHSWLKGKETTGHKFLLHVMAKLGGKNVYIIL